MALIINSAAPRALVIFSQYVKIKKKYTLEVLYDNSTSCPKKQNEKEFSPLPDSCYGVYSTKRYVCFFSCEKRCRENAEKAEAFKIFTSAKQKNKKKERITAFPLPFRRLPSTNLFLVVATSSLSTSCNNVQYISIMLQQCWVVLRIFYCTKTRILYYC
jgi:hypothetical protein